MLLGPDLMAPVVDLFAGSEGPPVVLLESLGCPVAFTAGCGRVERLSCLRITNEDHSAVAGSQVELVWQPLARRPRTVGTAPWQRSSTQIVVLRLLTGSRLAATMFGL